MTVSTSDVILDLANVINVQVLPTPQGLGAININTAALFSKETPSGWAVGQTYGIYFNATDVATDFGSGSDAAKIASAFFAQAPNPLTTSGYLVVIPRLQTPTLETVQAAIVRTINSVYYFGILIDEVMDSLESTFVALTAYVQSIDKMFFYCSATLADLEPG
jgi:hypothetical protein